MIAIYPDAFSPTAHDAGEQIGGSGVFSAGSHRLIDASYTLMMGFSQQHDTAVYRTTTYVEGCRDFPMDVTRYLGFRIQRGADMKYGWIKLSISDKNRITVFETAIQE